MQLEEVMRTSFAAREFTDEPVPDAVLRSILENARFAPSGGNRQGWKLVVIREQSTKDALAEMIRPTYYRYVAQLLSGKTPDNPIDSPRVTQEQIDAVSGDDSFVRSILSAPVLLLVLIDLRTVTALDSHLDRISLTAGASIYPFAWNILLAARGQGYGGTLTTFLCASEPEVQALLDIPGHMAVAAMLPIGRPVKQLTRLKRNPVQSFVMQERWDGEALGD